ncbi:hypothetical protein MTO96_010075 [Rhipicephalus appendiculatus]
MLIRRRCGRAAANHFRPGFQRTRDLLVDPGLASGLSRNTGGPSRARPATPQPSPRPPATSSSDAEFCRQRRGEGTRRGGRRSVERLPLLTRIAATIRAPCGRESACGERGQRKRRDQ